MSNDIFAARSATNRSEQNLGPIIDGEKIVQNTNGNSNTNGNAQDQCQRCTWAVLNVCSGRERN